MCMFIVLVAYISFRTFELRFIFPLSLSFPNCFVDVVDVVDAVDCTIYFVYDLHSNGVHSNNQSVRWNSCECFAKSMVYILERSHKRQAVLDLHT